MQSLKTESAHLRIAVGDDMMTRRKMLGLDQPCYASDLEVLVVNDYCISYDCGAQEIYSSGQAPFIQSKYLMDLITAAQRDIILGVSYETNIPPHIMQAAKTIEIIPFAGGAVVSEADKAKKMRSVYKRFHLCVSVGSYETFAKFLSEYSSPLALDPNGMRVLPK